MDFRKSYIWETFAFDALLKKNPPEKSIETLEYLTKSILWENK